MTTEWWKTGIIYQIYPRSFKDTTGNGIGDLNGITEKLDYLKILGIGSIWISPCYPSPMEDFGYDISNYVDIHPDFGTLSDFDNLVEEAHKRGLKIILDYVANHTSDQHPWYTESKQSRNNPKSDYYIWKDPKPDGSKPNNWLCVPGGSAWEWSDERQQYYYHSFLKCQPDVNWTNPDLQKEMLDVLRFWLDRGIDGFRIDMINWLAKDPEWTDNPVNPDYNPVIDLKFREFLSTYTVGLPKLFDYLKMISDTINSYGDKVIIGELMYDTPLADYPKYYGTMGNLVHLPGYFKFLFNPWEKDTISMLLQEFYDILPLHCWPNFQFGNHDVSRMASRLGGRDIARSAAVLLLTLKGTPFIYNGEELGMVNVDIPQEKIQDPTAKLDPKFARDPYRTPMQWNSKKNAGFSTGESWLPISQDYAKFNVENEKEDKKSFLNLYKQLIKLRNENFSLNSGDIEILNSGNRNCLYYKRWSPDHPEFKIIINFSPEEQDIIIESDNDLTFILNSYLDNNFVFYERKLKLRGNEAIIVQ